MTLLYIIFKWVRVCVCVKITQLGGYRPDCTRRRWRERCARVYVSGRPCPSLRRRTTTTTQQHYTSVRWRCGQRRERRQMVNCSGGQNRRRPTWLSIVHRARFWRPLNGHPASLSHVSFIPSSPPTLRPGPTPSRTRTHMHTHPRGDKVAQSHVNDVEYKTASALDRLPSRAAVATSARSLYTSFQPQLYRDGPAAGQLSGRAANKTL